MAKRNIDTSIDDAGLVVALGPGFVAGVDCHAVVETLRGPRLGRVLWSGAAAADTGVPGVVGGRSAERVVRAPADGAVAWEAAIGDRVTAGDLLGHIGDHPVDSTVDGLVRGLIGHGFIVTTGQKIGDVDPRNDVDCNEISDKALAIGGGVLEAATTWLAQR
jgi:xanthine dehydrogenase accessory factor